MPSSATITSFYNFSANTKARASQVNNNFDVFRGHIIPVDPNTATSINNTYDLGASNYYWRAAYINTINVTTLNQTNNNRYFNSKILNTTFNYTNTSTNILNANLTLSGSYIRNYEIGLAYANTTSSEARFSDNLSTSTSFNQSYEISLFRNTTTSLVGRSVIRSAVPFNANTNASLDISAFRFFDFSVSAGNHTYFYQRKLVGGDVNTNSTAYLTDLLLYIKEI